MIPGPPLIVRLVDDGCALDYRSVSGVARLMVGRTPAEVPDLLGSLFAVCPAAQRFAGRLVTAAAGGTSVQQDERRLMQRAAMLETVREHVLRIVIGWARALGSEPEHAVAAELNCRLRSGWGGDVESLIEATVFGIEPGRWLALDATGIECWARRGETIAATMIARELVRDDLPSLPASAPGSLLERFASAGQLVVGAGGWVAAAHLARLTDLAQLMRALGGRRLRAGDVRIRRAPGRASVRVACSRGMLVHTVRMAGGQVAAYTIESPTDRSFALGGAAQRSLDKIAAMPRSTREATARAMMEALDPCVEYRIEVA
ncbi:MAG: hypothetical protein AB1729_07310 [Pseudomonadota bacterium]